jgi:hypothetical protein
VSSSHQITVASGVAVGAMVIGSHYFSNQAASNVMPNTLYLLFRLFSLSVQFVVGASESASKGGH